MADLEIVLERWGTRCVARGGGFTVEVADVSALDDELKAKIVESRRFPAGTEVRVHMVCDRRIIPAWMRPYQSHYFNRTLTFVVEEGGRR